MRKMSSIVILAVIVLVAVSGIGSYNDLSVPMKMLTLSGAGLRLSCNAGPI